MASHIVPNATRSCSGLVVDKIISVTGAVRHGLGDSMNETWTLWIGSDVNGSRIFLKLGVSDFVSAFHSVQQRDLVHCDLH